MLFTNCFFGQVPKIHHDCRGYTNKYLRDSHNPFDESLWTLQVSHMTCATELSPLPCCNSKVAAAAIFNGSSDAFCAVLKQGSEGAKQATGYKTPTVYKRMSDILPRYQFKCCWPSLPRQCVKPLAEGSVLAVSISRAKGFETRHSPSHIGKEFTLKKVKSGWNTSWPPPRWRAN